MPPAPGRSLDAILATLRERGGRVTAPRRAILVALLAARHHVTAEELIAAVRRSHPDISPSTVYRTLHVLTDLGVVEHVHLGHGAAVYHLEGDDHLHLVCDGCGAVVELPDEALAGLAEQVRAQHGFIVQPRHFALAGRCAACSGAG